MEKVVFLTRMETVICDYPGLSERLSIMYDWLLSRKVECYNTHQGVQIRFGFNNPGKKHRPVAYIRPKWLLVNDNSDDRLKTRIRWGDFENVEIMNLNEYLFEFSSKTLYWEMCYNR